jgi:hypothetical protein
VDISSVARLAVGMIGMCRAIRETPNLPLHAPVLLLSDTTSWPEDGDEKVRATRFTLPILYIDLVSVYVLPIH